MQIDLPNRRRSQEPQQPICVRFSKMRGCFQSVRFGTFLTATACVIALSILHPLRILSEKHFGLIPNFLAQAYTDSVSPLYVMK